MEGFDTRVEHGDDFCAGIDKPVDVVDIAFELHALDGVGVGVFGDADGAVGFVTAEAADLIEIVDEFECLVEGFDTFAFAVELFEEFDHLLLVFLMLEHFVEDFE